MVDLSAALGPLALKNPILVAAGTFGYGVEFQEFFDIAQLGGVITKTLTLSPREGNPAPRVAETPSGMLNAVGLQNIGIDVFLKDKWPALRGLNTPAVVSVAGFSEQEFVACAERLQGSGAAAIELNLSCPNVAHGHGARCFAQNAQETGSVVRAVKNVSRLPVFAKLSPEVSDIASIARAASEGGADVLTLINTLPGMAIDVDTERPVLAHNTGGLSGPAIRPIAVRCIWEVCKAVKTPILGIGGVTSGRDALELILAGASAVAVGTANFWNPRAPKIVLDELTALLKKKNKSTRECTGAVKEFS
ncbi:MAG: dihydroorotate dehydrogenase B catalytic subunit [Elusimicrobia bacterium RIFCSPLOWO2_01_FULL_59_12]|nr:MAG: dihydroorotate dehydrogenase B catalytic subunit [Elusimicrobia bacterium RIFCSPLOWO2_01_FULL_59_12]